MVGLLASLLFLAALMVFGVATLRRVACPTFTLLEQVSYGAPLGLALGSLLILGLALAAGLTIPVVVGVGVICALAALVLWPDRPTLAQIQARFGAGRRAGRDADDAIHAASPPLAPAADLAASAEADQPAALSARDPLAVAGSPSAGYPPASETHADIAVAERTPVAARATHAAPISGSNDIGIALAWVQRHIGVFPLLVLGGLIALWATFYWGAGEYRADGLWMSQQHLWSDWSVHLGHTTSFAYGDNFPPQNPYYAGTPFNYHFLVSLTTASMVKLGMDPLDTLKLHDFIVTVLITLGVFAFARRLTGSRNAAALTVFLFLLGSGLGWLVTAGDINKNGSLLQTLQNRAWNYKAVVNDANIRWEPVFIVAIAPTRGFLYGLPLGLLALTSLFVAAGRQTAASGLRALLPWPRALLADLRRVDGQMFVLAGVAAGLLPLAHLGTFLALVLITPFLFLLFPSRGWTLFFGVWIMIAVPQMALQGGGSGGLSRIHKDFGWMADANSNAVWFWFTNLGLFFPLLALAWFDMTSLSPLTRRFIWGLMPVFVIANVVAFDPTGPWNNLKVLIYWFLGVCVLVSALLVRAWQEYRAPVVRAALAGVVATLVLSGLLMHLHVLRGGDTYMLLSAEEIDLAKQVREKTPPKAVFAVGLQHNHPVSMLAGRRVLMFFPGWLVSWGIDPVQRERDLRQIMAYAPTAPDLLKQYNVDYVVIGPGERNDLKANVEAYRARYPVIIRTPGYEVFAVSEGAIGGALAGAQ